MLQLNQIVLIYEEGVLSYNDIKSWQDVPSPHINTTWHETTARWSYSVQYNKYD